MNSIVVFGSKERTTVENKKEKKRREKEKGVFYPSSSRLS
jgi:hypothetical protein